jgi:hypothetical protein
MRFRPLCIVDIGTARPEIAFVGVERAFDRDGGGCGCGLAIVAARQLLGAVLRLEEIQDLVAVGLGIVVGCGKALVQ